MQVIIYVTPPTTIWHLDVEVIAIEDGYYTTNAPPVGILFIVVTVIV
jgi:hypothetical protein